MANGDTFDSPRHMAYSKSRAPIIGAFIDYLETSLAYVANKTYTQAEKVYPKSKKVSLSATFLAFLCLFLGLVCNVKFEVVTSDNQPLANDLHFMLVSKEDKLYIDDIDTSRVLWCIEAADCLVLLISCLLIWISSNVGSPNSEYMFLPWLGAALRGLFLRQAPTTVALIYTMFVINEELDYLFLTEFFFLFILEGRLWLEIGRLVRLRFELRTASKIDAETNQVETLWSNDDIHSIEVRNYIY